MNSDSLLLGLLIVTLSLAATVGWLIFKLIRLDKIRKEFYSSKIKKDLEQVLVEQNRTLTALTKDTSLLNERLTDLSILNKNNVQKVGVVRFNPFNDSGGNMSFALALLNDNDDGVVVSSLHSREGTRIYAKQIKQGASESKLTEEETEAIENAK